MYRRPRIIPCLTLQHYDLVKTVGFKNPRYIGDPVNSVRIFNNKNVDELCILDITATKEQREPDTKFLHEIASEAFMPLAYGGGIRRLDQAIEILRIGYEKIVINSLMFDDPDEVKHIADSVGSQSVVASIDYRKSILGKQVVFCHDGMDKMKIDLDAAIERALEIGAGEILLTNIDYEGKMKGFDIDTIGAVSDKVSIPVVANGGAASLNDIKIALDVGANAVAASSMFIFYGNNKAVLINTPEEKAYYDAGIFEK